MPRPSRACRLALVFLHYLNQEENMKRNIVFGLALGFGVALSGAASAADPAPAGDAAAGKKVFNSCRACHSFDPAQKKVGPSLAGVVGREAGAVEGYAYSPAMQKAGIAWTPENLDKFLENPREFMPGTKMVFVGVKKPADRENLIAYLRNPAP
jgi:cytochrome c